jgi:NhaP-type Na+/H+ or K+/H+ antiporter
LDWSVFSDPALTVAIALAAGVVAQAVAHHLRVPGIVLFLLAGVLLGPDVLGVVRPGNLGHGLELLVGFAVAIILFEGGLNLNLRRLRRQATTIRRLITVGALITAVGGAVFAHIIMGWDWRVSILFGTLVIVTGPTVIAPLVRRIRVNRTLQTILEGEGVLVDPVGAIIAVVALETVRATSATSAAVGLLGIPSRLLVGTLVGVGGGFLIGLLLRSRRLVPEGLENVFTLSLLLAFFEISNAILPESGIMQAAVAGLVVGNFETGLTQELREFKEQLTVMLVGLLFVILAADVRLSEVKELGWPGVWTILALMLLVRPVNVAFSTWGSRLSLRERAFISWLSPRGIVAAAVASLFAQRLAEDGISGGVELRAMVFLVIAATVVVQGLSGGVVASLLGVRRPRNRGYAVVGAHRLGLALGDALRRGGNEVVFIDTNSVAAREAQEAGFSVVYGNANDEGVLLRADVESRRALIAVTPNSGVNLLVSNHARELFRIPGAFVALAKGRAGIRARRVLHAGHSVLFGRVIDIENWNHQLLHDSAVIGRWRFEEPPEGQEEMDTPQEQDRAGGGLFSGRARAGALMLALTVSRTGITRPVSDRTRIERGDVVELIQLRDEQKAVAAHLRRAGWEPDGGPSGMRETGTLGA